MPHSLVGDMATARNVGTERKPPQCLSAVSAWLAERERRAGERYQCRGAWVSYSYMWKGLCSVRAARQVRRKTSIGGKVL